MAHNDLEKDTAVATTPEKDGPKVAPSAKSETSEKRRTPDDFDPGNDGTSSSSASTDADSIHSVADQRPSIHHTWSRNTGHSWPGDKDAAAITTVTTNATQDARFEVDFDDNGENPQDWPMARKALVIFFMSFSTLVVVMYSTSV